MTPILSFATGIPKGQPRVKAFKRGNHAGVYDPGTADNWKRIVAYQVKEDWSGEAFTGPVAVALNFVMPRPKGHYRTSKHLVEGEALKHSAPSMHTSRPDADNLAKAVLDALTNLQVWKDDSQVAQLNITKCYGEIAGCKIEVRTI